MHDALKHSENASTWDIKKPLSAMYKVLHEKILQKDINVDYEKLRSASLTYYPDVLFSSMGRE